MQAFARVTCGEKVVQEVALQDLHSLCCPAKSTLHKLTRDRVCLAKLHKIGFSGNHPMSVSSAFCRKQ